MLNSRSIVHDHDGRRLRQCYDPTDIHYVASGTYARVFRSDSEMAIFKVIKLIATETMECFPRAGSTTYSDALNEFTIMDSLGRLARGVMTEQGPCSCPNFPEIGQCFLVDHDKLPSVFADSQWESAGENLIIVMEDCGREMLHVTRELHPRAFVSIIKQILLGLVVAEVAMEFEHRDLHSCNVLLQPTEDVFVEYVVHGRRMRVPSFGYRVKIIDATFSRLRVGKWSKCNC